MSEAGGSHHLRLPLNALLPPVPNHPLLSALRRASLEKFAQIEDFVSALSQRLSKAKTESEQQALREELVRLALEWKELLAWSARDSRPLSADRANGFLEEFLKVGWSVAESLELRERLTRRPRGRPSTHKPVAVAALEARLADPRVSWRKLAQRLCHCPAKTHNFACQERLRREAGHLKRFLRKQGIKPAL